MKTISVTYSLKWRIKYAHHYQFTSCGKLFNIKTGKQVKRRLNGGSIGYWIDRKFVTLNNLRARIEKLPKSTI
jgi:hypothetical protein